MKRITKSTPKLRRTFLLCALSLMPFGAAPGNTQTAQKPTVTEVARELVCDCPDCGKQALDQCGKCEIGEKHRATIAAQLQQGKSKAQVVAYFANTYGDRLLGNPRPQGFNRSALLLPALAIALGMVPLGLMLARKRKNAAPATLEQTDAPQAAPQNASPDAPEDERVKAALRDLDS